MKVLLGELIVKKYEEENIIDEKLGTVVEREFDTKAEEKAYARGLHDGTGNEDFYIIKEE